MTTAVDVLRLSSDESNHAPDARLELTVLGGVDERVDAAVAVDQQNGDRAKPLAAIDGFAESDEAQEIRDFVGRPAENEPSADRH